MTNSTTGATVILATRSAELAMGLDALLLSIPPVGQVKKASNIDELGEILAMLHPMLVILDISTFADKPAVALQLVRSLSPGSLRVLLCESTKDARELVYDSLDTVILNGTDPGRLAHTLEELINDDITV